MSVRLLDKDEPRAAGTDIVAKAYMVIESMVIAYNCAIIVDIRYLKNPAILNNSTNKK